MGKNGKIIWAIVIAAVALLVILPYLGEIAREHTKTADVPTPRDLRLTDPDLFYAASSWSGMCSNEKGEEGGCIDYFYLYNSGKFIHEFEWQGSDGRISTSSSEKMLGEKAVAEIVKQIKDAKLLTRDCPALEIMDAGWSYRINLDGVKKSFDNPPEDCAVELNKALDSAEAAPDNNK